MRDLVISVSPKLQRQLLSLILPVLCLAFAAAADAADRRPRASMIQEDFPFQSACISANFPAKNTAMKGVAIRLGNHANVLFDTELLRMSAGWISTEIRRPNSGDGDPKEFTFISSHGVAFDGAHGAHPKIEGDQRFGSGNVPGWANAEGQFTDPRSEPFGPLPADWCRWDGLYVSGSNIVLSYTVHGTKIVEQPSSVMVDGEIGFVRTFQTEAAKADLIMLVCETPVATADAKSEATSISTSTVTLNNGTNSTRVSLVGAPSGVKIDSQERSRVLLRIPKGTAAGLFKVVIWKGSTDRVTNLSKGAPVMVDYKKGGVAHWPEPVVTKGALSTSTTPDGAYVTDSLTAPTDNPWRRRVRFAGVDFFSDGKRAALCTHDGDIWVVSGIDERLEKLTWRRFASGMYETLGLVIVDDVIYTSGRDQVTRYYDLNNDGEADYYENFNNQIKSTEGFHEFVFDLQRDAAGNFYFAKANPVNGGGRGFGAGGGNGTICEHSGCLFKLDKDGKKLEVIARGFRAPNGIGVSPEGQVTTSDNEGTWVPSTPINWIGKKGQFSGVLNKITTKEMADSWVPPLCWLSHNDYDNSGGGQVWVTSDKWGPFKGEMLHESYGKSSLFLVMRDEVNGMVQGGVVRFPLKFTSSCMRAHFNKQDGQLYIAGLSEWQSNAGKITGLDRVRYTGKPVYSVSGLRVVKGGVQLTFTKPIATDSAADLQNYSGKRWNYKRTSDYGSPEVSVNTPGKNGRDALEIKSAKLSEDGKVVTLEIADFKPVMQESIRFNLKSADGMPIAQEIQHTVHAIP